MTTRELPPIIEEKLCELDQLKNAVRLHSNNPRLLKMVGPSQQEDAEAKRRLEALDRLSPLCEWGETNPSFDAIRHREQWDRIMKVQGEYERRYC